MVNSDVDSKVAVEYEIKILMVCYSSMILL